MEQLLAGYRRYRNRVWPERRALFEQLSQGQKPKALIISCMDSRIDPAALFDADPGEMFVVRNVANLVPPFAPDGSHHSTSAALEFAVNVFDIPHIIVLGHSQCGGVHALLEGAPDNAQDFVAPWMSIAQAARVIALQCDDPRERPQICEQEAVKVSLANLITYPWIIKRMEEEKIRLHGAWLDIRTNQLMLLQPNKSFIPAEQVIETMLRQAKGDPLPYPSIASPLPS